MLLVRCCRALDARDPEAVAGSFVADAEIVDDLRGRTFATADGFARSVAAGSAATTDHLLGHGEIEVDGCRATSRASVTVEHARAGGGRVTVGGHYEDELVETPAGWRIVRRRFRIGWVGEGRRSDRPETRGPVLWLAGPQLTRRTTITAW